MNTIGFSKGTNDFADFAELAQKVRPYLAFTILNTVWRKLDKNAESILDVGCGKGEPMRFIGRTESFYTVGLDIFLPYLKECKNRSIYDDYILCDIRKLPLREKSFDVALCLQLLEHLERDDGNEMIQSLERVAREQVIITTPVGEHKQSAYDGNPYQEHRWIWMPAHLERFGYSVRGAGIRNISGEEGLASRLPKIVRSISYVIWVLTGPFTYFLPSLAGKMVCVKRLC